MALWLNLSNRIEPQPLKSVAVCSTAFVGIGAHAQNLLQTVTEAVRALATLRYLPQ